MTGPTPPHNLSGEEFCYLTTRGRVSGMPREIEIWFALHERTVYMLSGARDRSNWVRNLQRDPAVSVRIAGQAFRGRARTVEAAGEEDSTARRLLVEKYQPLHDGDLSEWGRTALPVAIEFNS